MPSGKGAKRVLILGLLVLAALFLAGLITGGIGTAILQGEDKEPIFVSQPEVHLPPQTIFPNSARDHYIEFLEAEEKEKAEGHGALTHHEEELVAGGPFGGGSWVVTNTMLSAWITSLLLIGLFVLVARRAKMVPGRLQSLVEIVVETLLNFVEGVIGRDMARKVFPLIATLFLFVLLNAWIALIPIYPVLGFENSHGDLAVHLLRSAGTDLNMPLALALVSFVFVEFLGLRHLGLSYIGKFIPVGSFFRSLRRKDIFGAFVAVFVGFLEMISEMVRIVSFTFRLFGNMTAGEVLVLMATFLVPFVATVAVYGLELLVGLVQALIFAGLTLVFATIAIASHQEEH